MVKVQVKGGTPRQTGTLCRTCRFGHIIRGFSASQEEAFCRVFYPERRLTFAVFECTEYEDQRLASKKEMEDIAWFLTTRKSGRRVGFVSAAAFREREREREREEADFATTGQEQTESSK